MTKQDLKLTQKQYTKKTSKNHYINLRLVVKLTQMHMNILN